MSYDSSSKQSKTKRILILNGTVYSERPNQIMGKLIVEISYKQERVLIESQNEASSQMFMQRETYVN